MTDGPDPAGEVQAVADLEPVDLYHVVRRAVQDAIWDVLGDLFTLLVAIVLVLVGVQVAMLSSSAGRSLPGVVGVLVGLLLVGLAVFEVYRTFFR